MRYSKIKEMLNYGFLFSKYEKGFLIGLSHHKCASLEGVEMVTRLEERYDRWRKSSQVRLDKQRLFMAAKILYPEATTKALFDYAESMTVLLAD